MLAVLGTTDPEGLIEQAIACKYVGDEIDPRVPAFSIEPSICPFRVDDFIPADVFPTQFTLRAIFDELLDAPAGSIEVSCDSTDIDVLTDFEMGELDIIPDPLQLVFPTGTACNLHFTSMVMGVDGLPLDVSDVPFNLQDFGVRLTVPADAEQIADRGVIAPTGSIAFVFNAGLDFNSVSAADFEILDPDGIPFAPAGAVPGTTTMSDDTLFLDSGGSVPFPPGNFTARLKSGASFTEMRGGTFTLTENIDVRFVVQ